METTESNLQEEKLNFNKENIKVFYKNELPQILKKVLLNPTHGAYSLFANSSLFSYRNTLLLMLSIALLYFIAPYLLVGSAIRSFMSFSVLMKSSIAATIFMIVSSGIAFGIKTLNGKPKFKNELLTGALCGLGLVLLLIMLLVVRIIASEINIYDLMNISRLINNAGFLLIIVVYIFLFMITIFQQSLLANGTKPALSWYISPLAIMAAFYITFKVLKEFLF
ncbi:MAG: hypothetical protein CVU03_02755 [Bacteroidetes bacterium HGW-Bacteroidetes-2]|jgi:hypothetical protein|nr:MAG: hypothetical protein CVU03_02755 [Bacteroidetes bacterium HGW-Bacteroidetes-2]